jgi:DNA-binding response OmpR family regulator
MHALLVEDHWLLARSLRQELHKEGFTVDLAQDGVEADHKALAGHHDVILLEMAVPRRHGLTLVQGWRRRGITAHILALTSSRALQERIRCLDAGADDCLARPFCMEELLARLRALVRRAHQTADPVLRIDDLEINTSAHTVRRGGLPIKLTPREYALLHFLALHRGQVVSRSMIWHHLYDEHDESTSNVVDVYIRYLRNKIDRDFPSHLIVTRRGEGYLLRDEQMNPRRQQRARQRGPQPV